MSSTIVIIDDEQIIISMLELWLKGAFPDIMVAGKAVNGLQGLALCREVKPDMVLLDIEMPGMDGLTLARNLLKEMPETRVIILTSHCDPYCIYQISQIDVHGYVDKMNSLENLATVIRHVMQGERYFAPVFGTIKDCKLSQAGAFHKVISPKEMVILALVAEGISDAAIADELKISPYTVITHRRNIRLKLNVHNDRDLIHYARQWGLGPLTSPESEKDEHRV